MRPRRRIEMASWDLVGWVYLQRWGRWGPECCMSWEEPLALSASSSSTGGTRLSFDVKCVCACALVCVRVCTLSSSSRALWASSGSWLLSFFFSLWFGPLLCQLFCLLLNMQSWLPAPLRVCRSVTGALAVSASARVVTRLRRGWLGGSGVKWRPHTVALSCLDPNATTVSKGDWASSVCGMVQSLSHLFPSSTSSFLSVCLSSPLLFLSSTNQQLCLEGNQAAPANYAALAAAPPSLLPALRSVLPDQTAFTPSPPSISSCPPSVPLTSILHEGYAFINNEGKNYTVITHLLLCLNCKYH